MGYNYGSASDFDDIFTLDDFDLKDETVLLRVDINSPLDPRSGKILDDYRIRNHLNTINELKDSKLIIVSHQSRPGKNDYTTLEHHARRISQLLGRNVYYKDGLFESHVREKIKELECGEVLILENARFYAEETYLKGDKDMNKHQNTHIVRNLAPLIDYYVHDAFAAAHRAQPTLVGFSEVVPSMAGKVMEKEIVNMSKAFTDGPDENRNKVAVLGGIKVDDSIKVAKRMLTSGGFDKLLTSGVVANIFLMAKGHELGKGNEEFLEKELPDYKELVKEAKDMLEKWGDRIEVPIDVVLNVDGERNGIPLEELPSDYPIFDIGLDSIMEYKEDIDEADLVILNGPAGAFEIEEFSIGTTELFRAVANSKAYSIIGGGESTAALDELGLQDKIDHVSTGGGSCINFLAGRELEGVEALKRSFKRFKK